MSTGRTADKHRNRLVYARANMARVYFDGVIKRYMTSLVQAVMLSPDCLPGDILLRTFYIKVCFEVFVELH